MLSNHTLLVIKCSSPSQLTNNLFFLINPAYKNLKAHLKCLRVQIRSNTGQCFN